MRARLDEPDVVVLDLRDGVGGVSDVEGSVVVLDHAETAAEHDHVYQALLGSPQVSGVICLAVDGGNSDSVVSVRPPPSLAPSDRAATLWVGHHHGIRWRPTETRVRSNKPSDPSGLCQLIDVLGKTAVFDAVVKCVSTLRYSTASAGMVLERATLPEAELRRVEGEAVAQFTDLDAEREVSKDEFRAAVRAVVEIDRTEDVLVADAELAAARARAVTALERVDHEITRLDHRLAPFPRNRPGRLVGRAVEEARAAARDFHEKATRQLLRIDGNLRGRRSPARSSPNSGCAPRCRPGPGRSGTTCAASSSNGSGGTARSGACCPTSTWNGSPRSHRAAEPPLPSWGGWHHPPAPHRDSRCGRLVLPPYRSPRCPAYWWRSAWHPRSSSQA